MGHKARRSPGDWRKAWMDVTMFDDVGSGAKSAALSQLRRWRGVRLLCGTTWRPQQLIFNHIGCDATVHNLNTHTRSVTRGLVNQPRHTVKKVEHWKPE